MGVIVYKIVEHSYDESTLNSVFSVNELKSLYFEWNKESNRIHPVNKEISAYDYVYSIQNINNLRDEYGYCFINEQQAKEGNYLFTLEKFILDRSLPESVVKKFVSVIVEYLLQFHRDTIETKFRIDRLTGCGLPYLPLSPQFLKSTKASACSTVVRQFVSSRDGIIPFTDDENKRLEEIADKMRNRSE